MVTSTSSLWFFNDKLEVPKNNLTNLRAWSQRKRYLKYAMSNLDRTYPPHSSSLTRIYYTSPLMHLAGEKKKKLYFPNPYFHKTVDT